MEDAEVDPRTYDYTNDPRAFSSPDGTILIPSLRNPSLHRIAYKGAGGWWLVPGRNSADASVTDEYGSLQPFATMEEALYAVLGAPVELPDDIGDVYHLLVDATIDDPVWVTFGREIDDTGPWAAYISQPAPEGHPAYFCGSSPLEALTGMFGIRPADSAGDYEYVPGS